MQFITNNWIACGLGAAISFTGMVLSYKRLLTLGVAPIVLNLLVFVLTTTWFGIWVKVSKTSLNVSGEVLLFALLASLFALSGNFLDVKAVQLAPNPGYAGTLKASQIVLITLISPLLFDSDISPSKIFGVLLVLSGIYVLSQ